MTDATDERQLIRALQPSFDVSRASAAKIAAWEKHAGAVFRIEDELIESGFNIRKLTAHMNLLDHWLTSWNHLQYIENVMD